MNNGFNKPTGLFTDQKPPGRILPANPPMVFGVTDGKPVEFTGPKTA